MKTIAKKIIYSYLSVKYFREIIWGSLLFFIFIIIATTLFVSDQIITKPLGWEKSRFITPYKLKIKNSRIASKGKLIVSSYESINKLKKTIYLSISFNGGKSFLKPIDVISFKEKVEGNLNPSVAISNRGIISVFWQKTIGENEEIRIYGRSSLDYGVTWGNIKLLNLGNELDMLPRIFYDKNDKLHLFYHGFKNGFFNLFHTYSKKNMDFGESKKLIKLTENMKGAFFPSITIANEEIYVTWQGKIKKAKRLSDNLFFKKSSNLGESWSDYKMITDSKGSDIAPYLLYYKKILYLTYQNNDNNSWGVKLLRSYDKGDSWEKEALDISNTNANCYSPKMVQSVDSILFVWYDIREKKEKVFYRKYKIFTKKLDKEIKLSVKPGSSKKPFPISQGEKVVVIWEQAKRLSIKESDVSVLPFKVYSTTHKDEIWSKKSTARLYWKEPKDESGISGYATMLNNIPYFNPVIKNLNSTSKRIILSDLEDGISYFHIRAIDQVGNYSRTIHYKLLTSVNPLSFPIVVSSTHREGKSSKNKNAIFNWVIKNKDRLKGFLYSLTKNEIGHPDKFIDRFSINFKNLNKGVYSFNIGAVDQTGEVSKISHYMFAVGNYKDIKYVSPTKIKRRYKKKLPVDFKLNFNFKKTYAKRTLNSEVITKNIDKSKIVGYSVVYDTKKTQPPRKVISQNNSIVIENLKDGDYYIGIRLKYFKIINNKKFYFWTKAKIKKFSVLLPLEKSRIAKFGENLVKKIGLKYSYLVVFFSTIFLFLLYFEYGIKLTFFFNKIKYNTKNYFGIKL